MCATGSGEWSCLGHLLESRVKCAWGEGMLAIERRIGVYREQTGWVYNTPLPPCIPAHPTGRVALSEALLGVWRGFGGAALP